MNDSDHTGPMQPDYRRPTMLRFLLCDVLGRHRFVTGYWRAGYNPLTQCVRCRKWWLP